MSVRIRSDETSFRAAAIFGSTTLLSAASCARPGDVKNKVIEKASTGIRGVIENLGAVLSLNMMIQEDPASAFGPSHL
jgi:hypothetical protein